jgi:2-haloalkanoic acid dehalogenase type II
MLTARPRAIAFDCYGTLLDVTDASFIHACELILRHHGHDHDANAFWDTWLASSRALSKEYGRDPENPLAGPEPDFHPFRRRWPDTFARAFLEAGLSADPAAAYETFHDTLSAGIAFPDTAPALDRLRPHFRVAVVSNADDDHLHHALQANGLDFEFILSSEAAQSYKPRPPIFLRAAQMFDLPPGEVLYVGDSPVMDVLGAHNAGMQVAWLNRFGVTRPDKVPEPELEVADLMALADILLEGRTL